MCDAYGLATHVVDRRLKHFHFTLEAALTTPANERGLRFLGSVERQKKES